MNEEALKTRRPEFPVHPLILGRWSQRSMSGEPISDEDLKGVFEAARWAPSSYNNQPWRFVYTKKDAPSWSIFFGLLVDSNKEWCKNAASLILVCSTKNFIRNKKPSRTHEFDTGAAWMCLALEAFHRGFVVHGMEGFDYDKARKELKIPDDVDIEAMVAIGKPAPKTMLKGDLLERETPSSRNPVNSYIFEGSYTAPA